MNDPSDTTSWHKLAQGPFALAGPVARPDGALPLRGDLAHIGLAGKYFVPHYAVPQPRTVLPGGAPSAAKEGSGDGGGTPWWPFALGGVALILAALFVVRRRVRS